MDLEQIQHLLACQKYYTIEVDGQPGPGTTQAVREFQEDAELEVDGIAGPVTQKALRKAVYEDKPVNQRTGQTQPTQTPAEEEREEWWDEIEYFEPSEFACKCGRYHAPYCNGWPTRMKKEAVVIANDARRHFGAAGHIESGLRCPQHNADQPNAAVNSQHMYGEAVDMWIEGVTADRLLAYIQSRPGVTYAYKITDTNIHFNIAKGNR